MPHPSPSPGLAGTLLSVSAANGLVVLVFRKGAGQSVFGFASILLATGIDLKELGFALAVVVLIGAAIIRRLLVPAALRLLGNHAWTWPRPRITRNPGT